MPFKATPAKPADTATTAVDGATGTLVVTVHSSSGIGGADVSKSGGDSWPATVKVVLELKGLEQLTLSTSTLGGLEVTTGINGGQQLASTRQPSIAGGADQVIQQGASSYWPHIEHNNNNQYVVTVPQALLEGSPSSLHLKWIDFFR